MAFAGTPYNGFCGQNPTTTYKTMAYIKPRLLWVKPIQPHKTTNKVYYPQKPWFYVVICFFARQSRGKTSKAVVFSGYMGFYLQKPWFYVVAWFITRKSRGFKLSGYMFFVARTSRGFKLLCGVYPQKPWFYVAPCITK